MSDDTRKTRRLRHFAPVEREAVRIAGDGPVTIEPPSPGRSMPAFVRPALEGTDLVTWAAANRPTIETLLARHGAIFFRGFPVDGLMGLADFVKTIAGELLEYRERSSPRTHVTANIYTSTEYPAHQRIFFHNENSYAHTWPLKLFFFCSIAPQQGGATPVVDCREVLKALDADIREEFIRKKVTYVRNLSDAVGLSWQEVFGTSDRQAVERQCRDAGYQVQWTANGLRTSRVGPAVVRHPHTGEMSWFNHATFFHVSTLAADVRDTLLAEFGEDALPNHTYYGDGSRIDPQVIGHVREAYERSAVSVPWQADDILLVDNILTAHGREAFSGPRRINVAMAEPCTEDDV